MDRKPGLREKVQVYLTNLSMAEKICGTKEKKKRIDVRMNKTINGQKTENLQTRIDENSDKHNR